MVESCRLLLPSKSLSGDFYVFSLVFLCLDQVGKERSLHYPNRFRPFHWSTSRLALNHFYIYWSGLYLLEVLFFYELYMYEHQCGCIFYNYVCSYMKLYWLIFTRVYIYIYMCVCTYIYIYIYSLN